MRSPSFIAATGDVPMFYGYDSGYVLLLERRVPMLTAFGIERLKPKGKPYKVSDGNALYLLVKPTGAKLWRVRYHFGGKEQMLSLGAFPAVTLAAARGKRDEALTLLANGINPSDQKKQDKLIAEVAGRNTFGAIAEEYLQRSKHARPAMRAAS